MNKTILRIAGVLAIVERTRRFEDMYPYQTWYVDQEMRYLDSMDDPIKTVALPENTIISMISEKYYGPYHDDFFFSNNQHVDCFTDTFQSQRVCNFKVHPLWQEKSREQRAIGHPLAPGSPLADAIALEKAAELKDF